MNSSPTLIASTTSSSSSSPSPVYPPNPSAMFETIAAVIDKMFELQEMAAIADSKNGNKQGGISTTTATNTKISRPLHTAAEEIENYNQYFKNAGIHFQKPPSYSNDHLNEYSLIDDEFDCNENININGHAADENDATLLILNRNLNSSCSVFAAADINDNNGSYDSNNMDMQLMNNNINSNLNNNNNQSINNSNFIHNNNNSDNDSFETKQTTISKVRRPMRKTPNTLSLYSSNTMAITTIVSSNSVSTSATSASLKKRKISNIKRNFNQILTGKYSDQFQLNGIVEECEYDSDIGKFNCKNTTDNNVSDSGSSVEFPLNDDISNCSSIDEPTINDLNAHPKQNNIELFGKTNNDEFNINTKTGTTNKIVMKRIEFFENGNNNDGKISNTNVSGDSGIECGDNYEKSGDKHSIASNECPYIDGNKFGGLLKKSDDVIADENSQQFSTILCLLTFLLTSLYLYCFPLPS